VIPTPHGLVRLGKTTFQRALELPRSALYRPFGSMSRNGDARLVAAIKDVLLKHPRYGYRQVTHRLRRKRVAVNAKRVLRLMRSNGLLTKPLRRPKWRGGRSAGDLPNLSKFDLSAPDQLWLTDITFVPLPSRWIYLAVILDAFRRCVGSALGLNITTDLTLEALRMALVSRQPKAALVHHSDRGSQYSDIRYQDLLLEHGAAQSFSRPGTPTDNPVCERFIGTLKREELWLRSYVDLEDARRSIRAFILDYNSNRSHSSLGKRSPIEFERMHRLGRFEPTTTS
jgi:putative transposase